MADMSVPLLFKVPHETPACEFKILFYTQLFLAEHEAAQGPLGDGRARETEHPFTIPTRSSRLQCQECETTAGSRPRSQSPSSQPQHESFTLCPLTDAEGWKKWGG